MMKVYIVSRCVMYEGSDTLKAFYDEQKAEEFIERIRRMNDKERLAENIPCFDSLIIEEMEVH